MRKCLAIAHRGYSSKYGDNNLVSFQEAINHSFDMIELDLQLSQDRQIMIYHDPHLKGIPLRNQTSKALTKQGLLTLEQLFEVIVEKRKVGLIVFNLTFYLFRIHTVLLRQR